MVGNEGEVTIEYKPFGIELTFTPPRVVDGGDVINLKLDASVSGIDATNSFSNNGISVAAFRTRQASTTVEMRDAKASPSPVCCRTTSRI